MKSGRQIVIVVVFICLTVAVTTRGQSISLLSGSNEYPANMIGAKASVMAASLPGSDTNIVPLIQFEEVPLTIGFKNLGLQAGINYMFDPRIGNGQQFAEGQGRVEPIVTLRWENITVKKAFASLCLTYGLNATNDPVTDIVLLRAKDNSAHFLNADLFGDDTNIIPVMEFESVPLTIVLKNLAKQARIKCILSPLLGYGQWGGELRLKLTDTEDYPLNPQQNHGAGIYEPQLSFKWENVTAKQAFMAICENYDLNVIKYPESGIIRVEPAD